RIFKGGLTGIAGRGMAMVVSAITLPLTVRYLGSLEYGIWVTISTSVVMLSVLDLGIANSLTNFISKAYAMEDEEMARDYFATAFWVTIGISILLGIAIWLSWRVIDWQTLFHLQDAHLALQARTCVAISLCFFLLTLPLNLANKVLSGYQQVHIANYFAMVNSLLGLVAIVTVILSKGTIVDLMATYCIAMLTGSVLLNFWLCVWHKPWLRPHFKAVKRGVVRELFGEGALFFVLQLSGLVVFNSDNLVITHYLGASDVTPYSVAWRLTGYASMMQSLLVPALWPAFAEAYHRRDMTWVRTNYHRIMNGSILAVGLMAVGIGIFGRQIIRIWAGPEAVPGAALLWSMCFWAVLVSITINQALLMAATQRIQLQAVTASLAAVTNLIFSIILVQRLGAIGVLIATIGSYIVFIIIPQEWEVRRILQGRYVEVTQC
ncbi:MAG: oligosaccharide flippase family protein, partial [Edaphobacter sp.]